MAERYTIWDCHLNGETMNFGGSEWVVDGERGRRVYPGTWPDCMAKRLYMEGLNDLPQPEPGKQGYCDGCRGAHISYGNGNGFESLDCWRMKMGGE